MIVMQELLDQAIEILNYNTWYTMGGVGVVTLLFGWIFGAIGSGGKVKRARGERDVANQELSEAKAQIDELFAAKTRLETGEPNAVDAKLEAEIESRESMIKSLGDDLARARSEIEQLKRRSGAISASASPIMRAKAEPSNTSAPVLKRPIRPMAALGAAAPSVISGITGGAPAQSAPAGPASAPPVADVKIEPVPPAPSTLPEAPPAQESATASVTEPPLANGADSTAATPVAEKPASDSSLVWRNRYLESRVRVLEDQLTNAATTKAEPDPVDEGDSMATISETDLAKMKWKTEYLQQRLSVLESTIVAGASPSSTEEATAASAEETAPETTEEPAETELDQASIEQELARLRWRTRFLEGRLAYLVGAETTEAEAVEEPVVEETAADEPAEDPVDVAPAVEMQEAVEEPAPSDQDETVDDIVETLEEAATEDSVEQDTPVEEVQQEETVEAPEVTDPQEPEIVEQVDAPAIEELADEASEDAPHETIVAEETALDAAEVGQEEDAAEAPDPDVDTEETLVADDAIQAGATEVAADIDAEPEVAVLSDLSDEDVETEDREETSAEAEDEDDAVSVIRPAEHIAPAAMSAPESGGDDLQVIDGIGPRINDALQELGVFTFAQIADWSPENAGWINHRLGFEGRVEREKWVEQAQTLVTQDENAL
ncbi:MAG: hypothetical protein AAFX02_04195 [Pseudomonadota bacterium]